LRRDTETGRISTQLTPPTAARPSSRKGQIAAAVIALFVVLGLAAGLYRWLQSPTAKQPSATLQRLTTNATENAISASAISPDGKYLAYSDKTGTYLRVLATGELHPLLPKGTDITSLSWFPDSSQLLASWPAPPANRVGLWVFSILGGTPRQLTDEGWSASVSSDGSQIAFLKGTGYASSGLEIWTMQANGADPRKLISVSESGGLFASPVWSPDGRSLGYVRFKYDQYSVGGWIELFDLQHASTKVLLSEPRLDFGGLKWLPDGRLVFAVVEAPPNQTSSNFFANTVDLGAGRFAGVTVRLTNGEGVVDQPSVTADSKHLVFNRVKSQTDVYVAEFSPNGPRLGKPRRLTLDDADDLPFDWTPDNKAVLFTSNRTGSVNIFRQAVDDTLAEMLVFGPEEKTLSRLSPDGSHIIYLLPPVTNGTPRLPRLRSAPINGGPSQLLVEAPLITNHQCSRTPATVCIFSQQQSKGFIFSVFDPAGGTPHEVAKIDQVTGVWNWSLSPDGKLIATGSPVENNRIRLLSLSGQPPRDLFVKGWRTLTSMDWAADSKGLFVTSNPTGRRSSLLYVDLDGNAHELWQVNSITAAWAIPSRNGKFVAIPAPTSDSNVWMAENF